MSSMNIFNTYLGALMLSGLIVAIGPSTHAQEEKCDEPGVAVYSAVQDISSVTIFASGVHRTGGFKNCLEIGPEDIFPPIYDFKIKRPTGVVPQVITPFTVTATFESKEAVDRLTVRDAKGQHWVDVVQITKTERTAETAGAAMMLKSTYQHSPVEFGISGVGFRGISITGQIADGETVNLLLDPNTCGLHDFGDRTVCTRMASTNVKTKLTKIRLADPKDMGRNIYSMVSNEFPKSLVVYLIVPPADSGYRIVLKRPNSRMVVALEKHK